MIIFGSRIYGKKDVVLGWGYCDHCKLYGNHQSYTGRKWGHIYFIPLIPEGPHVRVIKECPHCEHGLIVPQATVPDLLADIQSDIADALAALAGQRAATPEPERPADGPPPPPQTGAQADPTGALFGVVEMLYCLNQQDRVQQLNDTLAQAGQTMAQALVQAACYEFVGQLHQAVPCYQRAVQAAPNDLQPRMLLGDLHMKRGDYDQARIVFEQALPLADPAGQKLPVLLDLMGAYEALNDHDRLCDSYETCLNLSPELAADKKFIKNYHKACKKAARAPMQ